MWVRGRESMGIRLRPYRDMGVGMCPRMVLREPGGLINLLIKRDYISPFSYLIL